MAGVVRRQRLKRSDKRTSGSTSQLQEPAIRSATRRSVRALMGDMRIGILTGGGDCPGLNAVIRAVVVAGSAFYGDTSVGLVDGWYGMVENRSVELNPARCRGI